MKIFGGERHVVPLFQCPYVWQREENWEPLWQDFYDLCDRILASPDATVRGHFLGTLVLEQVPHRRRLHTRDRRWAAALDDPKAHLNGLVPASETFTATDDR